RLFLQQRTQTGPQDGVIVRQENSDFSPTAGASRIDHRRVSHSKSPTTLSKIRAPAEELRRRHRTCLTVAAKSPLGSLRRPGSARACVCRHIRCRRGWEQRLSYSLLYWSSVFST